MEAEGRYYLRARCSYSKQSINITFDFEPKGCESAAADEMTLTLLHVVMMMKNSHTHCQTLKSRRELSQR